MWINPIIFTWEAFVDSSAGFRSGEWRRSHEMLTHAEQTLQPSATELDRANAIIEMRRSIPRRIRLLDERYSLRSIPIKEKPSDVLKLLEFVGVVRPTMLQQLIDIRNAVEHEDADPPDLERCKVFFEFTWYFLKSTDFLTQRVIDRTTFTEIDTGCWIELCISPPDRWIPELRGWIPSAILSDVPRDDWPLLNVIRLDHRPEAELDDGGYGDKRCDRYIEAEVRGSSEALRRLYQRYFEIV